MATASIYDNRNIYPNSTNFQESRPYGRDRSRSHQPRIPSIPTHLANKINSSSPVYRIKSVRVRAKPTQKALTQKAGRRRRHKRTTKRSKRSTRRTRKNH